jgi:hypothetical protein
MLQRVRNIRADEEKSWDKVQQLYFGGEKDRYLQDPQTSPARPSDDRNIKMNKLEFWPVVASNKSRGIRI